MRLSAIVCLLLAIFLAVPQTLACGPFFPEAILTVQSHPDLPLKQFAAGNIGIIRSSWARSYLVVAYRYLSEKPLSSEEQNQALALWHLRLLDFGALPETTIDKWQAARKAAGVDKPLAIDSSRDVSSAGDKGYEQYLNCLPNAFTTAAETLHERAIKYGAGSELIKDWVQGQDAVFCHCAGRSYDYNTQKYGPEPPFPQAAPANADALFKADRAYQQAAAFFYAQQFDKARAAFAQIAADTASPWSALAPYLVARTLVRQATLAPQLDRGLLQQAAQQAQGILQGNGTASLKSDTRKLLSFIELRLQPAERLHALAADLQNPAQAADFSQNLYDYTQVIDNELPVTADSQDSTSNNIKYGTVPAVLKADEMTDWLITMQSGDKAAQAHALSQFEKTGSLPWLTAAMALNTAGNQPADNLLAKATSVAASSPAYPTISYALIKLFKHLGKSLQAEERIKSLLELKQLPPSAENLVLDEQQPFAKSFEEFLKLSVRRPAVVSTNSEGFELPDDADKVEALAGFPTLNQKPVFAPIYAHAWNTQVPLALLAKVAESALPPVLAKRALNAAWTRAVLLDDQAAADAVTPLLFKAEPQLAPWLRPYSQAKEAERKFAAIFLLLHNPGLRPYLDSGVGRETPIGSIDDYSDNWWCAEAPAVTDNSNGQTKPAIYPQPPFLSADETAAAARQYKQLTSLGSAPDVLAQQTLDWANAHPTDPRVPEALSLSVKATRFGCKDGRTNKLSKEAFQLLHSKYPQSPWTKKTPYWY
jgi:hypothetical protein